MSNETQPDETNAEKDIVDHLSEATGYFHDSEAEKLRDIAEAGGQKPSGVVRAAVEDEIEKREWRITHFEHDEDRGYISHNPYEYYRIHKRFEKEYQNAISELSEEDVMGRERVKEEFEHAGSHLQDKLREHRAKAEAAERYLEENGEDPEEVLLA